MEPKLVRYLHDKATALIIPINGTFELTARCNFNCAMCYVHLSAEEQRRRGRELTGAEWIEIAEQAKKAGTVFLLLTGGEPLIHPDFEMIYRKLKTMGFMISINSNASLIQGKMLELFRQEPPYRLNLTLYAVSNAGYERQCGVPCYDRVLKNIQALRDAGINLRINLTITPTNRAEMPELIHTAKEGIYWYNGGVHYVGMHSFLMILTAITIRIIQREEKQKGWIRKVFRMIVAVILAFVVAGANFVTALQGLLILVSIMVMEAVRRRPETFWILPVLGVYVAGFYLNVSAPGNLRRADSYIGWGMSPGKAIVYSFAEGGKRAWQFTGWMALVILLFLLPILLHMVSRTTFTFPLPGVVSLWSVCLYATGFTPSLYSLGHGGLGRTLNAVKLTWQLLLLLNVIYWCGWIWKKRKGSRKSQMFSWWFYPLIAVMVLTLLLMFFREPLGHWMALALLVLVFGIPGDLFESLIKRHAGVKDAGTLIPGHGGLLDRFDDFLLVAPAVLIYLKLFTLL